MEGYLASRCLSSGLLNKQLLELRRPDYAYMESDPGCDSAHTDANPSAIVYMMMTSKINQATVTSAWVDKQGWRASDPLPEEG